VELETLQQKAGAPDRTAPLLRDAAGRFRERRNVAGGHRAVRRDELLVAQRRREIGVRVAWATPSDVSGLMLIFAGRWTVAAWQSAESERRGCAVAEVPAVRRRARRLAGMAVRSGCSRWWS